MQCRTCKTDYSFKGRLEFRARCTNCDTPLHVCLQCAFYDTSAYNSCKETKAERVVEKGRENRCEYFSPGEGTDSGQVGAADSEKAFDDLFS